MTLAIQCIRFVGKIISYSHKTKGARMKYLKNIETGKIVAVENDFFQETYLCDCHTGTGGAIGCLEAGCDDNHVRVIAGEWFDGQNWQSIIINDPNNEWEFADGLCLSDYYFLADLNPRNFWTFEVKNPE